ncbi:hypothetical protein POPTR_014G041250v4 [Populus trichocarpa]|uniref:Uncharacterized protein n=1 Tax=Populus trichocarpa TaxID=3694 RepID=A0ACC0RYF1_POPTR|nr:hypothetical protein BDE02_14G032900 [Populus trichocarpa]KAI9381867.1 hypothetical protein POPTR_014G041250v4 [Populus trichocarpa]
MSVINVQFYYITKITGIINKYKLTRGKRTGLLYPCMQQNNQFPIFFHQCPLATLDRLKHHHLCIPYYP